MDPAARKRDLSDASYVVWDRWFSLEDFSIKYPKFSQKAQEAFQYDVWPTYQLIDNLTPESGEFLNHDINDESDYSDPLDVAYFDSKKRQIRVAHMEYWKYKTKYHVYDPQSGKLNPIETPWAQFKKEYKKTFPGRKLRYETSTVKEVWWVQFCGAEVLYHGKAPIDYPGFSLVPCFLFGDVSRRKGYHYGIVELMKDPQREINKRTSQTLNLFNQQVQPGVYAEARAFANIDQAEQSLKESGSMTLLQDGAISQKRFMERSVPTFPSAVLQMGEYAREMIRHISGINPDLLGMNDKRQEAGIVVQLRQQQGMAILKPVFKAYNVMREEILKRLVAIVMTHMPSQQILKIMGEPGRYTLDEGIIVDTVTGLSANIRDASNASYDIDTEPETASMTQNALELATFMEMNQNGIPVDPTVMINKTNIPISEKLGWIDYINAQQQAGAEQVQAEMDMKIQEMQNKHDLEMRKLDIQEAIATRKADDQVEKDMLKVSVDQEKLRLQKTRDDQSAQIKATQVLIQAQLGAKKEAREFQNMMMDADIDKKRLILDVVEVMAQSKNAQTQESVKAALDMYKLALDSKNMKKERELKYVTAVLDAYTKMDVESGKRAVESAKLDVDASGKILDHHASKHSDKMTAGANILTSASSDKAKLAAESIKAQSAEKISEKQAAASVEAAKHQATAAKEAAKTADKTADKKKPL
jgi:hypothetical protein